MAACDGAERLNEERVFDCLNVVTARSEADTQSIERIATQMLQSTGQAWKGLPVALQRRLQDALFPEGIVLEAGQFRTHAINPVFSGFGGPFMQVRAVVRPSDTKLEPQGRRWHRLPHEEQERRKAQRFSDEIDIGVGPPHYDRPVPHSPPSAA